MKRLNKRPDPDPTAQLRHQLTEAGFPRGTGVASVISLILLLCIAAFTALYLATAGPLSMIRPASGATVPNEVTDGQQHATASLAVALGTSATSAADDLRVAVSSGVFDEPDTNTVLTRLSQTYPGWRGITVLDAGSQKALGTHGEPVPTESLRGVPVSGVTVRPVVRSGGTALILTTIPLPGTRTGQLLVVSSTLRDSSAELDKDAHQSIRLVAADGTVVDEHGPDVPKNDNVTNGLIDQAATAAAAGQSGVLTGAAATQADPGKPAQQLAPVVSYAPVSTDGIDGSLGLSVVSASRVPVQPIPARWPGLIPAGALLVLAFGGFFVLRRVVVAPIRRLRSDALAVASGDLTRPVHQSRVREVNRLTNAVELYRTRLRRAKHPAKSAKAVISAQLVVTLVALCLLGWSAAVAATIGRQHAEVSPTMVSEHGLRVSRSADTLRRSLTEGLSDLQAIARLGAGKTTDQVRPMLDELASSESRFRSVYLADAGGQVVLISGREALRDGGALPEGEGLHQHNTSGRVPVVYAYTHLGDTGKVLVGEFDVPRMAALLQPAGGRMRVVDEGSRTIADTEGYLAFEELTDATLRKNVSAARTSQGARETTDSALVAAQGLATKGSASTLHWVVVAEQPVGSLGVSDNTVRDGARVAALLTAVVALMLFGWHLLTVLRPLRRVADAAVGLAEGDTTSVVYPQRQDEIGTIASCVEICRQALAEGTGRLGQARRPAGAATDPTELLQRIEDDTDEPLESKAGLADVSSADSPRRPNPQATVPDVDVPEPPVRQPRREASGRDAAPATSRRSVERTAITAQPGPARQPVQRDAKRMTEAQRQPHNRRASPEPDASRQPGARPATPKSAGARQPHNRVGAPASGTQRQPVKGTVTAEATASRRAAETAADTARRPVRRAAEPDPKADYLGWLDGAGV
ncbi:HAMP domain-containing protein [Amycolatopsis sp. H20-H5]|uniref:HAMP domain-containing protein n=1 Tax=Amycolatopsis sp. H20-H5 TaxID=3046309 RepID=UPI002DBF32CC|nr:HAMP domain-containing protein [Amycolatopsis sp. H20-H5]MEC3977581.1 HAMP domain-containing protein [Amycolatopsis sp. H20-H5]